MNTERKLISGLMLTLSTATILALAGCGESQQAEDDHAGHDHGAPAAKVDDHAGHEGHDEAEGESDEQRVELTDEQQRRIGLSLVAASTGTVAIPLDFPGVITLDPDGEVHVTPLATGIVASSPVAIGDLVEAGAVLAVIDSAELAEAKLAYVTVAAEVGWGKVSVPRAEEIAKNVQALIGLIHQDASPEELAALNGREMGSWRADILSALADHRVAAATLRRERALQDQKVSSQQEVQEAEAAAARAEAELSAVLDTARYEVFSAHAEALRSQQTASLALVSATTRLHMLGVNAEGIEALNERLMQVQHGDVGISAFSDVAQQLADIRDFGRYQLRAPRAGVLVDKHLAIGERVADDESVARIVDTSTVWVRVNLYQRQIPFVRVGSSVSIRGQGLAKPVDGTVTVISPLVDPQTRTVEALIRLPNPAGDLRPGIYVTASIAGGSTASAVLVPKDAVQIIGEQEVVFVPDGDGFTARPVHTGAADNEHITIIGGLTAGTQVVVGGAFDLKAKIVTSALGGHAGHGH